MLNFSSEMIMEIFLSACGNSTVNIYPDRKLCELEYAGDVLLADEGPRNS